MKHVVRHSQGAAYVELALVLPVILSIFLWSVDISGLLSTRTMLASLSRETATNAFRDCRHDGEYVGNGFNVTPAAEACLSKTREMALANAEIMGLGKVKGNH